MENNIHRQVRPDVLIKQAEHNCQKPDKYRSVFFEESSTHGLADGVRKLAIPVREQVEKVIAEKSIGHPWPKAPGDTNYSQQEHYEQKRTRISRGRRNSVFEKIQLRCH